MQTKQQSLPDEKNKFTAEIEADQSTFFIDYLLSMPADEGEFERLNIQLRDFDNIP